MIPVRSQRVAVWGAGGHAKVVAEALRLNGNHVGAFVDSLHPERDKNEFAGATILGVSDRKAAIERLAALGIQNVALGFGHCQGRLTDGLLLLDAGLRLISVVHPSAVLSPTAVIGAGVFLGANAVLDVDVTVGDFSILNHGTVICHDTVVGTSCTICPGVYISGHCSIGDGVWVGAGSTVRDKVSIGDRTYVGCGSNVVSDIAAESLVYGNPARVVRRMSEKF